MTYTYMVLQDGSPMQLAEKGDDYWALYFAARYHGPTLFKARREANNAVQRQRAREKKHGHGLGYLSIMRVLLP